MDTPGPMVSYYNEQTRISILMPENWEGQVVSDHQFRISGPAEPAYDGYRATMSYLLGAPQGSGREWLEAFAQEAGARLQQSYDEFRETDEQWLQLSTPATVHLRHYEWRDRATGQRFAQMQALILVDRHTFYVANAATLIPLAETYMPIFDAILRSTRIIPRRLRDAAG